MLSDREEHELALLEQSLHEGTRWRREARLLRRATPHPHSKITLVAVFGVFVTVMGLITGADDLVNEGLLIALSFGGWRLARWLRDAGPAARSAGNTHWNGPGRR